MDFDALLDHRAAIEHFGMRRNLQATQHRRENEMTSRKPLTDSDEPDADGAQETEPGQENGPYAEFWARNLSIADLLIPIVIVAFFAGWELVNGLAPQLHAETAVVRQVSTQPTAPARCDGDPNFDRTC